MGGTGGRYGGRYGGWYGDPVMVRWVVRWGYIEGTASMGHGSIRDRGTCGRAERGDVLTPTLSHSRPVSVRMATSTVTLA